MSDEDRDDVNPPGVQRDLRIQAGARAQERKRAMSLLREAHPPVAPTILAAIESGASLDEFRRNQGRGGEASPTRPRAAATSSSWGSVTSKFNDKLRGKRGADAGDAA